MDCLRTNDPIRIRRLFKRYKALRLGRLKQFYSVEKFDLSAQEAYLEKMEGSARYMKYQLYRLFKSLPVDRALNHVDTSYRPKALRSFQLRDKPWMVESNSVRYFYSTGFNMLRLMDKLKLTYKDHFFDDNTRTPFSVLSRALGD